MSLALSPEQTELRAAVADLMAKRVAESHVRRLMTGTTGHDPDLWADLARMGLLGLTIPEQFGGAGAGAAELAVVGEQMGRALMPGPYLSTAVLVPHLLLALGDTAECAETLPRIAEGELIAAVAFAETGPARPPEYPDTTAGYDGTRWLLTGEKTYVIGTASAERFYVLAQSDSGAGLFAVERGPPGLSGAPLPTVDPNRRLGRLTLTDTPARLIGDPGSGAAATEAALERTAVALIAEQAGGARRVTEMATDYARTRYQFGRAIGSFQAVKHMCVDMLLESESAVSAARHIAAAFDSGDPDRSLDLALAQAYCSGAYVFAAATCIQVHGGIGFTWDHPAHLYLRRARCDAQILGDPAWFRERYIRLREERA